MTDICQKNKKIIEVRIRSLMKTKVSILVFAELNKGLRNEFLDLSSFKHFRLIKAFRSCKFLLAGPRWLMESSIYGTATNLTKLGLKKQLFVLLALDSSQALFPS